MKLSNFFKKKDVSFKHLVSFQRIFFSFLFLGVFLWIGAVYGNAYHNLLMFWKGIPAYTWVGRGANANWNTIENWSTQVVPGPSDTAIFDNNCTSNCSPTINLNISIGGILI
ncbi:MAG: hypothetical protein ACK5WZ_11380, partial [Pseudobdellovibrionaceae bacterium]